MVHCVYHVFFIIITHSAQAHHNLVKYADNSQTFKILKYERQIMQIHITAFCHFCRHYEQDNYFLI